MTLESVRDLYERYPYPVPEAGAELIDDVANAIGFIIEDDMRGWAVLDAGCGTGHRLVSLAKRYPHAEFVGFDMSTRALQIAEQLAARHRVTNISFVQGVIPTATLPREFDLVVSTGVIHHLNDPCAGITWLSEFVADNGLLFAWLYHAVGERERLLQREMVMLLSDPASVDDAIQVMRSLNFHLADHQYGTGSRSVSEKENVRLASDVDAFTNSIVSAWEFADIPAIFKQSRMDWVAANGITMNRGSLLLELGVPDGDPALFLHPSHLFDDDALRARVNALSSPYDRLRVIELQLRPTGFSVVAGRGAAFAACATRIADNVIARPRARTETSA